MSHPRRMGRIAVVVALVVSALVVDSGGRSPASAAGTEYRDAVLADGPLAYWRLGEPAGSTAADEMGAFPATYLGNPGLGGPGLVADADSAPVFDGVDDLVAVPDADAINLQPVAARTIEAWFRVSDVNRRQVVVEEGGITRGITVYVDQGEVYFGGWNRRNDGPDAPWGNIFFSTPVTPDTPHHVVLVLDAAAGTLSGYLDGQPAGSSNQAGTLYWHGSDTGIGAMKDASRFHDSHKGGNGFYLDGVVDEVAFYNSVLSASAIGAHYAAGLPAAPVDPSVGFVSPSGGEVVSGVVTVEVLASDPQDAVGDLVVGVSTDGGGSFGLASLNAGSGFFEFVWDTESSGDGGVSLVAEVTDSDGNSAAASVGVTVDNAVVNVPSVGFVSPSGGEVVVDGGVSFVPAVFDAGSGFFELVWDTSLGVDGAVTLVAEVTDSDGNSVSDSVAVTVDNAALEFPSVGFVSPSGGEVVSGVVSVEVLASDPQDAVGGLGVEVSFDGGVPVPALFNAVSGFHEFDWDTGLGADGAVVLVANVVDSDGNSASDSVAVTVNNAPPGAYVDAVLASGPDVYWRLGESVGLTAVDVVSGVDGSYSGGPVLGGSGLVADVDAAPDFDGVDDFVAVPMVPC